MQFYTYDFSEWLPLNLGEHGFFTIQPCRLLAPTRSTRPFLIRVDGELAGFVTVDDDTHIDGARTQHRLLLSPGAFVAKVSRSLSSPPS
jgi:predicted acetyltransferase